MSDSSILAADWLPVQEALLRGLNHTLSNRVSSLHAIMMLTEGAERLDPKMHEALTSEVEQLSALLQEYRCAPSDPTPRRDPSRFRDALTRAAGLLAHHPECRDVVFLPPDEEAGVEPVALLGKDALRACVLLLLPLARGGGAKARVETKVRGEDGWVHVTALASQAAVTAAESPEFAALGRFADAEGGNTKAPPGGDALMISLPGLSRSRDATG